MNTWETIIGVLILVVSLFIFWQNYNTQVSCNSLGGQISNFFSSIVGGSAVQACYNSGIIEIASIIAAIIGLAVVYFAISNRSK